MTEPSQYFKGRTVQEQMNEVIGYVDVRSAEVATNAIAADVAQVHQDMLDADADATAAAASAAAAAGTLANAVKKTGEASQSIAGDIAVAGNLTGGTVTVPAPVNNTDAATKKYVDDQDALNVKLTGAQNVAGVKTFSDSPVVPTEATGTFSTKAATSDKVKNELDAYAPMVRTSGNQTVNGKKSNQSNNCFEAINNNPSNGFICKNSADSVSEAPSIERQYPMIVWKDKDDNTIAMLRLEHRTSDQVFLMLYLKNTNGIAGYTNIELGRNQIA